MNAETYFALKAERETIKTRLLELNKLINPANKQYHFEPLTYAQFGEAIEYWYNAHGQSLNAYWSLYRAEKISWSCWKERYDEFITTGKCTHIYTNCVMSGMDYETAFIKAWNEAPIQYRGGFPIHKSLLTKVIFK